MSNKDEIGVNCTEEDNVRAVTPVDQRLQELGSDCDGYDDDWNSYYQDNEDSAMDVQPPEDSNNWNKYTPLMINCPNEPYSGSVPVETYGDELSDAYTPNVLQNNNSAFYFQESNHNKQADPRIAKKNSPVKSIYSSYYDPTQDNKNEVNVENMDHINHQPIAHIALRSCYENEPSDLDNNWQSENNNSEIDNNTLLTANNSNESEHNNDWKWKNIKNENNNKTIDPIKEEYKNRSYLKVASFLKEQNKDWDNKENNETYTKSVKNERIRSVDVTKGQLFFTPKSYLKMVGKTSKDIARTFKKDCRKWLWKRRPSCSDE